MISNIINIMLILSIPLKCLILKALGLAQHTREVTIVIIAATITI